MKCYERDIVLVVFDVHMHNDARAHVHILYV